MSDDYDRLKALLYDREWRFDNLYWIQDAKGDAVRFKRNEAQRAYWDNLWYRNIVLKARQLGFSTEIALMELDTCLFNSNTSAGIIDFKLPDAKLKLAKIKFAYERLPEPLKLAVPLVKDNTEEMVFGNDSKVQVGTSHRGGTLQILHVSEYGRTSAELPDTAREIKTGAFGTVHSGNMIHVESTGRGQSGEFYEMAKRAEDMAKEGRELSLLDFKFHFYAWWKHKEYRLQPNAVAISAELNDYFEELGRKHGIALDLFQRSWYAAMHGQMGPDDIKTEFPSTPDEAFFASLEGAYFKRELSKARGDSRIGQPVPHDNSRRVNTFWDIGTDDMTAIWFHQTDGVRHRFIDYYENSGEGLQHYAAILDKKYREHGYNYGSHYAPHDLENREWASNAKPRTKIAEELGIKFKVVPKVSDKGDAIEAARRFLNLCWFDNSRTVQGIKCLDNYTKQWNERLATWRDEPLHNWASHGADALMTGVVGLEPERVDRTDRHRALPQPRTSTWAA